MNFSKKPNEKVFGLKDLDRDALIYKVFPRLVLEIARKYFRMEIEGAENVPSQGPGIIAPNHSGFSGLDAILLNQVVQKEARRSPRVMTHHLWFLAPTVSIFAEKMGFSEATFENGVKFLKGKDLIILFPEGEHGNFKPTTEMYQLQEFRRGFIRMALLTGSPIIPTVILGAEETHINLSQLKFTKFLRGLVIPLPLNIIPLPARWKIRFLEPIHFPYKADAADDAELVHELAAEVQEKMQKAIRQELRERKSVYF